MLEDVARRGFLKSMVTAGAGLILPGAAKRIVTPDELVSPAVFPGQPVTVEPVANLDDYVLIRKDQIVRKEFNMTVRNNAQGIPAFTWVIEAQIEMTAETIRALDMQLEQFPPAVSACIKYQVGQPAGVIATVIQNGKIIALNQS